MEGRPGVLQSMGSQRVGHDGPTELNGDAHIENRLVDAVDGAGEERVVLKERVAGKC